MRLGATAVAIPPMAAWIASRREVSTENPAAPERTEQRIVAFMNFILYSVYSTIVIVNNDDLKK